MASVLMVFIAMLLLPSCDALARLEAKRFRSRTASGWVNVTKIAGDDDHWLFESNGYPDHSIRGGSITTKNNTARLAKTPNIADDPTCLPMGPIAYAKNGVAIFNALDSSGRNAVELEIFDECKGHSNREGTYHYHQNPVCLGGTQTDKLIGVALDGFPIYGNKDCRGNILTSDDLDECHGRYENGRYRYRLTDDYPYVMGCFKGDPSQNIEAKMLKSADCRFLNVNDIKTVSVTLPCTRTERKIDELYNYLQSYRG